MTMMLYLTTFTIRNESHHHGIAAPLTKELKLNKNEQLVIQYVNQWMTNYDDNVLNAVQW